MDLNELSKKNREILSKKFIEEVILPQWKQLSAWNQLTLQTEQLPISGILVMETKLFKPNAIINGLSGKVERE